MWENAIQQLNVSGVFRMTWGPDQRLARRKWQTTKSSDAVQKKDPGIESSEATASFALRSRHLQEDLPLEVMEVDGLCCGAKCGAPLMILLTSFVDFYVDRETSDRAVF